jgi:acyl dehydratase
MQITSEYVGLTLREYDTRVLELQAMYYAAAVGDDNPRYFDDERPSGVIAPPMLSVALTWPVTSNLWDYLGNQDFPVHLLANMVHYSEYLVFHKLITPGMHLVIRGQVAAILPRRSGTQVILSYHAQEAADGELVFTEYIGGLLRGVVCADLGRGADLLPAVPALPEDGEPLWRVSWGIDPLLPYIYDACAQVHFPIHTSASFAHQVGLPGIVLQGTASLAMAARELINREAAGDPHRLKVLACNFGALVLPGTQVELRLLANRKSGAGSDLFFELTNQQGKRAIRNGYMRLA